MPYLICENNNTVEFAPEDFGVAVTPTSISVVVRDEANQVVTTGAMELVGDFYVRGLSPEQVPLAKAGNVWDAVVTWAYDGETRVAHIPYFVVKSGGDADVIDRVRNRLRDNTGAIFAEESCHRAVAHALRATFPSAYRQVSVSLGTIAAGVGEVDTGEQLGYVYDVQYKVGGRWISVPFNTTSTGVELRRELTMARQCRAIVLEPLFTDGGQLLVDSGDGLWLDIVVDLAAAFLLEEYLSGRVHYDKYTTSSMDDAISSYEVRDVLQLLKAGAFNRMAELRMAPPEVRTR